MEKRGVFSRIYKLAAVNQIVERGLAYSKLTEITALVIVYCITGEEC